MYALIPSFVFSSLLFAPLALEFFFGDIRSPRPSVEGWSFGSLVQTGEKDRTNSLFFILLLVAIFIFGLTDNFLYTALFLIFFTPLFFAEDATKLWAHGAGGVMLGLAGAWSGMVEVLAAGIIILFFILLITLFAF